MRKLWSKKVKTFSQSKFVNLGRQYFQETKQGWSEYRDTT